MLVFSIKNLTSGGQEYAAGQFIVVSASDGAAMVTAGTAVACPFDPLKITLDKTTAATAAPASANFAYAFGARKKATAPVVPAAILATVTTPLTTITVTGGPAKSVGTIVVTYAIDTGADKTVTGNIAKGDTAGVAAGAVVGANTDADLLLTSGALGVINVAAAAGKAVTKLTVAVTGTTR
jgi:hypothetical protein